MIQAALIQGAMRNSRAEWELSEAEEVTAPLSAHDYFSRFGLNLVIRRSADPVPIQMFSLEKDGSIFWLDCLSSRDSLAELWAAWIRYLDVLHWHRCFLTALCNVYARGSPEVRVRVRQWAEQRGRSLVDQQEQWPWTSARYCSFRGLLVFEGGAWETDPSIAEWSGCHDCRDILNLDPARPNNYMEAVRRMMVQADAIALQDVTDPAVREKESSSQQLRVRRL